MNYYRRYVGDYMRDTGHLSLAEVGAYDRLLDHYYATEKPLPAEYEALYRLARAMTKAEQEAVRTVADQFFTITHDALRHNKRADQELTKAQPTIDAARTNGVKGGRPRKNPMGLSEEPNGVHPPTTNHQPPTTSLPTSNPQPPEKQARKRAAIRPDGVAENVWNDFLAARKAKRSPLTDTAIEGIEREAKKAGMTLQAALETACARGWQGFEAAWLNGSKPSNADAAAEAKRRIFGEKDVTDESERL